MRVRFGDFAFHPEARQLFRADEELHLVPKAFELLELLLSQRPRAVSKERIHDRLWPKTFVSESTLSSLVVDLRAALGDDARKPRYLRTVHGFGYAFCGAAVTEGTADEQSLPSASDQAAGPSHRARPEAYDAFLRGQQLKEQEGFVAGRILPAVELLFEEATRLDPEFADAWGGLALNRTWEAFFGLRPHAELLFRAREAADRALALSENVAMAWAALGMISLYFDWDFVTARRQLERAVSLAPRDPAVRHAYADYFVVMGRAQESLDQVHLARDQNPNSLRALLVLPGHAVAARRYQEAIDEARSMLASHPEVRNARHFLARALWLTGRYGEAIAEFGTLWGPASEQLRVLDHAFSRDGPRGAMKALADHLAEQADTPAGNPAEIAAYYAMCQESDAAFVWLEKAFVQRAPGLLHLPADPFFDPIRSDPRIDDLCRRVGLPIEAFRGPTGSLPPPVEPG